jgi:signal transduction histidine kinase/CheY-like chemotaxis protein/AraC-like DNA-binding protein/streptogramin lyase
VRTIFKLTILFLCGSTASLQAQARMESLTVADGLSQGFVTSMMQDAQGFIWMGTFDGLNRYDGYTVRHFKPKPFDSLSIQSSYITCLYEDLQHFMWVGTTEGLYLFDPLKENFYYLSSPQSPLSTHYVKSITGDKAGNIFVQIPLKSDHNGIFRLNLPKNFSKKIAHDEHPLSGIRMERVAKADDIKEDIFLLECVGDTLILARSSSQQYFRYSSTENLFRRFDLRLLPHDTTLDHNILWGKNGSHIFRVQMPDGTDSILPINFWPQALRMGNGAVGAWFYPKGPLVVVKKNIPIAETLSASPAELMEQPFFDTIFTTLLLEASDFKGQVFRNDNIMVDRNGLIWITTGGWGVRKFNPRQISFGSFLTGESVSALRELPNGRLWIRLYSDESLILNPATGQKEPAPWEAATGKIWLNEVFVSQGENYWMIEPMVTGNTLLLFEKKTGRLTRHPESMPFVRGVPEKIIEDKDGNIWIAAHRGLLYRCRPGQRVLESFSFAGLVSGDNQGTLRTTAVTQDARGDLWLGTNHGVVHVSNANGATPLFFLLNHNNKNLSSISIDWVTCISLDPTDNDVLWLGTRGGGINRFHIPTQSFTFWTEAPNGLPDNVVYGILPDDQGNLWCSTNRGICRFTPSQNAFSTYQESEGLSSTEFNTNAFLRTKDGRFWFGGVSGLNVFRPEEIIPQKTPPPVAITGIKVRGVVRFPDEAGLLTLPFAENNVLFEFAALDFTNPATNRFRHRLKGIDNDWVYDGTVHSANYSALPPGRYELEVQGATADSPWSERTTSFTLVILAPWYRSWLAYFAYLLLAAVAVFGYIRYREQVFKLQNTATLKQRESERLKEFEAIKNQFFANVAHELRTPLTVILGLADRLRRGVKGDSVQENAQMIIKQSDQLLQLTNQVLDLARLESDHFQLQLQQGDIIGFIKNHTEALAPLAASKGIDLSVESDHAALWTDFDQPQVQKILNNLISNAIRHTMPGGKILVKTSVENPAEWLNISVEDTGEGIAPEDLPRVFDRFFQSSKPDSEVGASGIGLTLTRDLVQLMGGRVTVESAPGQGSVFSIMLPIPDQIVPIPDSNVPSKLTGKSTPPFIPAQEGKKPLMLVLEDNPDVLGYLRKCLQPYFRLAIATNGEMGVEKTFELVPDIILTDIAMPLKNGYEFTTIVKQDERTSHIPIVMLTAKVESNDRMEGYRRGANAYLTKPFDESELLLVLQNLLKLQHQWQHRYAHYLKDQKILGATDHAPEALQLEDKFMQKMNEIFEQHYTDDSFNLDRLCRILNMSSSQLDRKMKALANQSPMLLLRSFRLQKAQALLQKEPQMSIKEACFRTGFKSPSHFSRLYSKEFGAPPSEG